MVMSSVSLNIKLVNDMKTEKNINVDHNGCSVMIHKLSPTLGVHGNGRMTTIKGHRIYIEDEHGQYKDDPRMIFAKKVAIEYLDKLEDDWIIEVKIQPAWRIRT